MEQKEKTKSLILDFYTKILGDGDLKIVHQIIDEHYIQHNPLVKTGRTGLLEALAFLREIPKSENPPKLIVIVEQNFGIGLLVAEIMGEKTIVFDLFRIENDKIVEHWDAIQKVAENNSICETIFNEKITQSSSISNTRNKLIIKTYTQKVLIERNLDLSDNFFETKSIFYNPENLNFKDFHEFVDLKKLHCILAEDKLVFTQGSGLVKNQPAVIYSLYNLKNRKIEECLSIYQFIPEQMAHNNGMI